jgi:hypothetical protein
MTHQDAQQIVFALGAIAVLLLTLICTVGYHLAWRRHREDAAEQAGRDRVARQLGAPRPRRGDDH